MNVAVLASPENIQQLFSVLEILRDLGVPAYGLKIKGHWDEVARQGLSERIARASHLLFLAEAASIESPWFVFSAGYGMGKESRMALYRLNPAWDPPAYISRMPILDGEEELKAYYRIEFLEWTAHEARRLARTTLLELGISLHTDSLVSCVSEGDTHGIELFLKAGFLPNIRDKHGVPLLCLAARNKHKSAAELLLEMGASIDLQSEDRGYSALMDAALAGSTDLVELFLHWGADPNLQSKDGQTALVVAVGRNDAEIVRRLLGAGADPNMADKLGLSAKMYASLFKNPTLLSLFESHNASAKSA